MAQAMGNRAVALIVAVAELFNAKLVVLYS
jgi:hypothetical protein